MSIVFGGQFTSLDNAKYSSLCKFDGSTLTSATSIPITTYLGVNSVDISSMVVTPSNIIYIGCKTPGIHGLYKWNGSAWSTILASKYIYHMTIHPSNYTIYFKTGTSVYSLTTPGDTLTQIGVVNIDQDGFGVSGGIGIDGSSNVYVVGYFTLIGTSTPNISVIHAAKWNGSSWSGVKTADTSNNVSGLFVTSTYFNGTNTEVSMTSDLTSSNTSLTIGMNSYTGSMSGNTFLIDSMYGDVSFNISQTDFVQGAQVYAAPISNEAPSSMAVSGSNLYYGSPTGIIRKYNGTTWSVPYSTNGNPTCMCADGSTIYIINNPNTGQNLDWWDGSSGGSIITSSSGISGMQSLAKFGSSTLYIGGLSGSNAAPFNATSSYFPGYGLGLMKMNTSTTVRSALTSDNPSGIGGTVGCMFSGNYLYIAGTFSYAYSNSGTTTARSIAVYTSGLMKWLGALYSSAGGESARVTKIIKDSTGNWYTCSNAVVYYDNSNNPTSISSGWAKVVKWNGTAWSSIVATAANGTIYDIAIDSSNNIYACGNFTTINGVSVNRIAKWNGTMWSALGTGLTGGTAYRLAIYGASTAVYVAGQFTNASGTSVNYIAKWNGSAWSAMGTGLSSGLSELRGAMAVNQSNGDLYVGGEFTSAGGTTVNKIAKWNGTAWSALGSGTVGLNHNCYSLYITGSKVYAGGIFTAAGGITANCIACYNTSNNTWSAVGTGTEFQGKDVVGYNQAGIKALNGVGNTVYAGFAYTGIQEIKNININYADQIYKWDGSNWLSLASSSNNVGVNTVDTVFTIMTLPDLLAPIPGNGNPTCTVSNVAETSLTLNWIKATDDTSGPISLQYQAYYHTSDISSVNDMETIGTPVGSYTVDINTKPVNGLTSGITYYFNVIVKDEAGNKAAYSSVMQSMPIDTPPTPGNSGTITTSSIGSNTVTLNWTAATDDNDAPSALQYLAYYSTSSSMNSVSDIKANGIPVGSYE